MLGITHFSIPFTDRSVAQAVRVAPDYAPEAALAALRLPAYKGMVVMHGGAGSMETELVEATRVFLAASLAPFAQEHHLLVVDGGTRSGAMAAMGAARRDVGGTYPLVGVCPSGTVDYPGRPANGEDRAPLDPDHSHFILVTSDQFGAESDLLVGLLSTSIKPGLALIVNGGEIVANEAQAHARQGNLLVTVRGSGRIADDLADPHSEARAALPPDTRLEVVDLNTPATFMAVLKRAFG